MTFPMLVFGLLTLVSALGVIFFDRPLYSALSLVVTLFFVAINFALLGAQFLAVTQIMVYAGAIMVLVVFVIMLLGLKVSTPREKKAGYQAFALGVLLVFVAALTQIFHYQEQTIFSPTALWKAPVAPVADDQIRQGTTEAIGGVLYTRFVYPFEVVSLLLLAAIIGATVIAFENKRGLPLGRGLKAMNTEGKTPEQKAA